MLKKKWLISIVSSIILAIIVVVIAWNTGFNDTNATVKKVNNEEKTDTENTKKDKESEDKETEDIAKTEDKKEDKDNEKNKDGKNDKEVKETIALKDDGTKVETKQTEGTTPSATVKVEGTESKKAESKNTEKKTEGKNQASKSTSTSSSKPSNNSSGNSSSNSSSTSSSSSNSNTTSKPKESKPKDVITTKTTTATESIAFKTTRQNDSSLEKGKETVSQNGQNGEKTITYKETYTNGKLTSRNETSSKVTKNPIDKIVKVGTKEAKPTYLSASDAHSILAGSGMTKSGNTYSMKLSLSTDVKVTVGGNHVTGITFSGDAYVPWKHGTLKELQEILGNEEGREAYNFGQSQAKKIEKTVRAAANALYGSGTSQANSLYSQIINSETFSKTY